MIVTLLGGGQARRHHRDQPQGDRQPPQEGPRGRRGGGRRRSPDPARPRRPGPSGRPRGPRPRTAASDVADAAGGRTVEPRCRDDMAVGVAEAGRRGGRARSSTRRGRSRSRTWSRSRGPRREPRAARGPAAARPADAGIAPARRRRSALAHILGDARHDPARPRPVPRAGRGGCTRPCAGSRRRSSTTAGSRSEAAPPRPATRGGGSDLDGRRPAADRGARHGRRQRIARRGGRGRRDGARAGRGRRVVDRRRRRPPRRSTWEDILIVAPVQRPGRRDRPAAPPTARRVGTVDKFQGQEAADQHLFADDLEPGARATRDGFPVQRPSTQRRDVASALRRGRRSGRRTCGASGRARRTRCGWRTRSAASSRWPRRRLDEPTADVPEHGATAGGPDARSGLRRAPIIAARCR